MSFLKPFPVLPPMAPHLYFGNTLFSPPEPLADATMFDIVLSASGLYVIMVVDTGWGPLPYRPLYFGESETVRTCATRSHENYASWQWEGGSAALYRAFHYMSGSTRAQRQAVESVLIAHYKPP